MRPYVQYATFREFSLFYQRHGYWVLDVGVMWRWTTRLGYGPENGASDNPVAYLVGGDERLLDRDCVALKLAFE